LNIALDEMEAKAPFIADSRNSFQLSREFCQTLIGKSIFFRTPGAGRASGRCYFFDGPAGGIFATHPDR